MLKIESTLQGTGRVCLVLICLSVLSACGLTTSDEERMVLADQSIEQGQYRAAMIELKKVLSHDEDNAQARLKLATVSLGLGDFVAAEVNLQRAIDAGLSGVEVERLALDTVLAQGKFDDLLARVSDNTTTLLDEPERLKYLGRAHLGLGKPEAARTAYQALEALSPGSRDAALGIAAVNAQTGRSADAISSLQGIVDSNPQDVDAQLLLGTLHQTRADYASAERAFEAAVNGAPRETGLPRYLDSLSNLIDSQLSLGALEDAGTNIKTLKSLAAEAPPTLFLSSKLARANGDVDAATRDLQQLLQITPNNIQAQFILGQLQLQRGNLEQSEEVLSRLITLAPNNIPARKLLAQVQLQQTRPDAALAVLSPIVGEVSDDLAMQKLYALARLQQGDVEAAIENLQQARSLDPSDRKTQLGLASLQMSNGDFVAAEKLLRSVTPAVGEYRREALLLAALEGQEKTAEAREFAARLSAATESTAQAVRIGSMFLLRSGAAEQAEALVETRLATDTDNSQLHVLLGDIYIEQQKQDLALTAYSQATSLDAENLQAALGSIRVALLQERTDDATLLLQQALRTHPDAALPQQILIDLALRASDFEAANATATSLAALETMDTRTRLFTSNVMLRLGRLDEALAQSERAVEQSPRDRNALYQKTRVLMAMQRGNAARANLLETLVVAPEWLQARATLAVVEMQEGMFASADESIQQIERSHPGESAPVMLRGEWLARQDRFAEASEKFAKAAALTGAVSTAALREFQVRQAGGLDTPAAPLRRRLELHPDDVAIRMTLGQHLQSLGDTAGAVQAYTKVLEADAQNTIALNNLAWQYQQMGQLPRAIELGERAYRLAPDSAAIADTLGWAYRDAGRTEDALRLLKHANSLAAGDPEIQYHLAAALLDSGDANAAKQSLQQLIDNGSGFPSRDDAVDMLSKL